MADQRQIPGKTGRKIPFHDLQVIEVELHLHVVAADRLQQVRRGDALRVQVAGYVLAVEWLKVESDPLAVGKVRCLANLLNEQGP